MTQRTPVARIGKHRPVPPPNNAGRVDTQLGHATGQHVRFASGTPTNAQVFANRIEKEFWNGNPVFHCGHAFDEIALILAELDDRITALEP